MSVSCPRPNLVSVSCPRPPLSVSAPNQRRLAAQATQRFEQKAPNIDLFFYFVNGKLIVHKCIFQSKGHGINKFYSLINFLFVTGARSVIYLFIYLFIYWRRYNEETKFSDREFWLSLTENFVSSLYLLIQSSTLKKCIEHCLTALATLLHVFIYLYSYCLVLSYIVHCNTFYFSNKVLEAKKTPLTETFRACGVSSLSSLWILRQKC